MKVFTFSFNDKKGGAAISAYRLHTMLKISGIDIKMFVARKFTNDESVIGPRNTLNKLIQLAKQKICQVFIYIFFNKENIFISPSLFNSHWHNFINKSKVDIVHLHWINLEFFSIKDISKIKKPIIWTLHDMWAFSGSQHLVYDNSYATEYKFNIFSTLISKLDYLVWKRKINYFKSNIVIVAPSQWLASCIKKSLIFKSNPVYVIPNPIDSDSWNLLDKNVERLKFGFLSDDKLILFSCSEPLNNFNKGFDLLLESLSLINSNFKYKLVVIGHSKPNRQEYSKNIIFLGKINNQQVLNSIYRCVDFTILPSRQENLSNVAIESMLNERPVIAFNCTGNPDIIVNNYTGLLVEAYSTIKLAQAIENLFLDKNLLSKFSNNSRLFILKNFDSKIITEKYTTLYNCLSKNEIFITK